jgi:hypothetical protein
VTLPRIVPGAAENEESQGDQLRETWREVMSVRRSTQQFRGRLARTLPTIEEQTGSDPCLGDVATTVAVLVRILDWVTRELKDVYPPEELFEVIELPFNARRADTDEDSSQTGTG